MKRKQIDEIIRLRWPEGAPAQMVAYSFARNDVLDLLDALGAAQAYNAGIQAGIDHLNNEIQKVRTENDRLRQALRQVEHYALKQTGFSVDDDGEVIAARRQCQECGARFVNGEGEHRDGCLFKLLEE